MFDLELWLNKKLMVDEYLYFRRLSWGSFDQSQRIETIFYPPPNQGPRIEEMIFQNHNNHSLS